MKLVREISNVIKYDNVACLHAILAISGLIRGED